jgi:hypothetical protein
MASGHAITRRLDRQRRDPVVALHAAAPILQRLQTSKASASGMQPARPPAAAAAARALTHLRHLAAVLVRSALTEAVDRGALYSIY